MLASVFLALPFIPILMAASHDSFDYRQALVNLYNTLKSDNVSTQTIDKSFEVIMVALEDVNSMDSILQVQGRKRHAPGENVIANVLSKYKRVKETDVKYKDRVIMLRVLKTLCDISTFSLDYADARKFMLSLPADIQDQRLLNVIAKIRDKFDIWWLTFAVENWPKHPKLLEDVKCLLPFLSSDYANVIEALKSKLIAQFKVYLDDLRIHSAWSLCQMAKEGTMTNSPILPWIDLEAKLGDFKEIPGIKDDVVKLQSEVMKEMAFAEGCMETGQYWLACTKWLDLAIERLKYSYSKSSRKATSLLAQITEVMIFLAERGNPNVVEMLVEFQQRIDNILRASTKNDNSSNNKNSSKEMDDIKPE